MGLLCLAKFRAVLTVLWLTACTIMFSTMHHPTRFLVIFLMLAVIPVAVIGVLVFASLYLEKQRARRSAKKRAGSTCGKLCQCDHRKNIEFILEINMHLRLVLGPQVDDLLP
jgi:hypothetical protein